MSRRQQRELAIFRRTVVVVDDDPRVRESLDSLLSSAGIEVRVFSSAGQVLESDALADAGCLITDVRMPGVNGWELFRSAVATHPLLPVIFVTAHQDQGALRRALDGGAFAFLYKPFDGEELLGTVEAAFKSNQLGSGLPDLTGL
jgi:two-component system response regulator FixJ